MNTRACLSWAILSRDLFEGQRPASIDDGVALVQGIGDEVLGERTDRAVAGLPEGPVYAGFSFGAGTAQRLAQTRPGARGALLYEACLPITGEYAKGPWPGGVPVQIHGMDKDPFFALEGDIDAARELVETVGSELAELFVSPGDRHLFTGSSLPSYDPGRGGAGDPALTGVPPHGGLTQDSDPGAAAAAAAAAAAGQDISGKADASYAAACRPRGVPMT